MRILQLHNRHVDHGGAVEVVHRERELLESAGHAVDTYWVESRVHLERSRLRQAAAATWNVEARREVEKRISDFAPDVLHLHTPFPFMSTSVLRAAREAKLAVVMTSHAFRIMCPKGTLERDGNPCEKCVGTTFRLGAVRHACYHGSRLDSGALALSSALQRGQGAFTELVDLHLALTSFSASILERDGIPADKIVVHPHIVPVIETARTTRSGYVYVGRLVPEKGVGTLIDAWHGLGSTAPELTIVGDGPDRSSLETRAPDTVRFVGRLDSQTAMKMVARAEALLFPSEWREGLGLSWVEALGLRTPVIYSDVGNFSTLLDGYRAGLSFPTGDAAALAQVVRTFMQTNGTDRIAFGDNGRLAYERDYSSAAGLQRLINIYNEAVLLRRARTSSQ